MTPLEVIAFTRRTIDKCMADPDLHQALAERKPHYLEVLTVMARAQRNCDNAERARYCEDMRNRLEFWVYDPEDDDGDRIEFRPIPRIPSGSKASWGP